MALIIRHDRIDQPTPVLTYHQALSSTGWTNFVIDPERHRAFPGTTSAWTVITGRVCRQRHQKKNLSSLQSISVSQIFSMLAMKDLLAW